jgi:hypothetical protein
MKSRLTTLGFVRSLARFHVMLWSLSATTAFCTDPKADGDIVGEPAGSSAPGPTTWNWRRSESSTALLHGDRVLWRFNYGPELPKPYFHPIATLDGRVLTWDPPPDHVWHHGLWFSWKYINGVNYWEHNAETGRPDGRTLWSEVQAETRDDNSAVISMKLSYQPAADSRAVLKEERLIKISSPDAHPEYHIDWTSTFSAVETVTLDRTPPKAESSGGYAGLSVRFAKSFVERQASSLEGPITFDGGNRHRGRGVAREFNGFVDGVPVGLAFLDHPQNPRHPTPWYLVGSPVMNYVNAAVLNDEPLTLDAGERLILRYRLIVHRDRWDANRLEFAYKNYAQGIDGHTTR